MGITQRVLLISLALSACIGAGLLLCFSHVASAAGNAGVAAHPVHRPARPEDAQEPSPRPTHARVTQRIEAIADNLLTPSGHLNQRAVRALRAHGPAAVPILLGRFTGEETPMQEAILAVLADSGELEVAERLVEVLQSQACTPRMAARIGAAIDTRGDPALCDRLETMGLSPDPVVRAGACMALQTCPRRTAAEALLRLLKSDEDETVRARALASLRTSHGAFLEQALRFGLSDTSSRVRLQAVHGIEEHRLAAFAGELRTLLKCDPDPSVKRVARRALEVLQ